MFPTTEFLRRPTVLRNVLPHHPPQQMRPRTLFHHKRCFLYSVPAKLLIQMCEMGDTRFWRGAFSKMDGDVKRGNGEAQCHIGPQKLISIIVHIPMALWAQVALAHYSNPYGPSFMGKGKYGVPLAHPLLWHAVFVWVSACVGGCNKRSS